MTRPRVPGQRPAEPGEPAKDRKGLGAHGESLAERHLRALGMRVEARNVRTRAGEIDLLARRGRLWIAVEVKTRRHHDAPEQCLADAQRERLTRALLQLAEVLEPAPRRLRIDVIAVVIRSDRSVELRHFAGNEFEPRIR
ncbi:MAG: YraN family protein [Planctomycetota bacterium]